MGTAVLAISAYVLWKGAGAWSLDSRTVGVSVPASTQQPATSSG